MRVLALARGMDGLTWAIGSLVAAAVVVVVVLALRHESSRSRRRLEAWRRFASERGFRLIEPSGPWYRRTPHAIEGTFENVPFRLDTYVVSTGKTHITFTRLRAGIERSFPAKLVVAPRTFLTSIAEALGRKSLRTGDSAFDRKLTVRSKARDTALRAIDEDVRARALAIPRSASLQVADREAKVWWRGDESDPAALEAACRLLAATVRGCARA